MQDTIKINITNVNIVLIKKLDWAELTFKDNCRWACNKQLDFA